MIKYTSNSSDVSVLDQGETVRIVCIGGYVQFTITEISDVKRLRITSKSGIYVDTSIKINLKEPAKLDKLTIDSPVHTELSIMNSSQPLECDWLAINNYDGGRPSSEYDSCNVSITSPISVRLITIDSSGVHCNAEMAASSHIWVRNSALITKSITTPYLLIENSVLSPNALPKGLGPQSLDDTISVQAASDDYIAISGKINYSNVDIDERNSDSKIYGVRPKITDQVYLSNDNYSQREIVASEYFIDKTNPYKPVIYDRRRIYTYWPGVLGSELDIFKSKTGYTDPNLNRFIDQNAEIMSDPNYSEPELDSRHYSVGVYSLNSYRTTERVYHLEDDEYNEIP